MTSVPPGPPGVPARIFHLALASEWRAAVRSGSYTTSTLGRTLAQEGFIHASRADQWQGVRERFYSDVDEPLLLLVIDTGRLDVPVVAEPVPDSTETFPHIYGPLPTAAVVQALPVGADGEAGSHDSFSRVFLGEMLRNAMLGLLLIAVVTTGVLVGLSFGSRIAVWIGFLVALAVGLTAVTWAYRRR
jgi:uncharacterized protein (DUF952 family)